MPIPTHNRVDPVEAAGIPSRAAMLRSSHSVITPGWQGLLVTHGLDTVDGVYRTSAGHVVTRSGSTEVRRLVLEDPSGAPQTIFIKKYWVNRPGQLWSGMFRGTFFGRSKARREFENLGLLRSWGLDSPEPIAFGEERHARWLLRSCLISAGVPNPLPLDVFIRDHLPGPRQPDPTGRRRALIETLAAATRRLHDHRFVHHDYFWRNIILSGGELDHFFLIDAHKGHAGWRGSDERSRAIDLAALDAPALRYFRRTERLRFFLLYCGLRRLDARSRSLLRATLERAAPMRVKQGRRVEDVHRTAGLATVPPDAPPALARNPLPPAAPPTSSPRTRK
jgi:tRNA A-37 threonylcarbamoyl transferase component Bud32